VITGATGARRPDHVFLNGFRLADTSSGMGGNHHVEDVHARKAEYENYAATLAEKAENLIHNEKDSFRAGFSTIPSKEELLPEIVKYQGFLKDNMSMADMLLTELYSNFAAMSENIQGQAYWDNNKRISEDLFQIHFNMSISIAKEVTFFDTLD